MSSDFDPILASTTSQSFDENTNHMKERLNEEISKIAHLNCQQNVKKEILATTPTPYYFFNPY